MRSSTFRLLILMLAVVALLGLFVSLDIVGGDDDCDHVPDITTKEVTQAGNCTTDEIGKVKCKICNQWVEYSIPAEGAHKYGTEIVTYRNTSNEVHEVVTRKICSVCNYVDENKTQKAHVLGSPISFPYKFATCAEEGNVAFECSDCGYTVLKTLPKLPIHTYHDATCTVCGSVNPDYDGTPNTCTHSNKAINSYGDSVSGYKDYCSVSYEWYCFDCGEFGGLIMACNNCQTGSCKYCDCH